MIDSVGTGLVYQLKSTISLGNRLCLNPLSTFLYRNSAIILPVGQPIYMIAVNSNNMNIKDKPFSCGRHCLTYRRGRNMWGRMSGINWGGEG